MNYKKTYTPKNGYTPLCEIGKCSLKDLEFGILELSDGQSYTYETKDREVAFIILGGKANVRLDGYIPYGFEGVDGNDFRDEKSYGEFNLEEAKSLMEAAGYNENNHLKFEYLYSNSQFHADVAQILQQMRR